MELNKDKSFFKCYKELFLPPYKLDAIEVAIYGLLAERYQFFNNLPQSENLVKNSKGQLGILFSETNIAESLNTTRPKVSRTIAKLELFGLLEVERKAKKPSVYIVKNIPAEINNNAQEYVADRESKKKLTVEKWRESKYGDQDNNMYQMIQGEHVLNDTSHVLNDTSKDSEHVSNDTTTCIKSYNNMYQMIQQHVSNEYSSKNNKEKELLKNHEPGTASLSESACPPAIITQDNDGIQGDADTSNGEGFTLPSKKAEKDNGGLSDMMSPSDRNTSVVAPGGNTDQTNDGIKQWEQSLPGGPSQSGINNKSEAAATTQNLPKEKKEKTLKEWLIENCKIQWIIDDVLTKIDGDQIMPREYTPDWDAIMQQVATALPSLKEVLLRLGQSPQDIDNVTRYVMRQPNPRPSKAITYLCCEHSWQLRVYYVVDAYLAA